ncbi:MAG: hypothetical protein ABSH44_14660 [Bryobacteraceae bacterium]
MEEPLKHLMQELGNAINDSLSESDRIAEAIGEIKKAGYDEEPRRNFEATGKIKFTTQDHRFLRALKIAVDDENR